jgi:hypothetical protein
MEGTPPKEEKLVDYSGLGNLAEKGFFRVFRVEFQDYPVHFQLFLQRGKGVRIRKEFDRQPAFALP